MYSLYRNKLLHMLGIKITNLMDIIQFISNSILFHNKVWHFVTAALLFSILLLLIEFGF